MQVNSHLSLVIRPAEKWVQSYELKKHNSPLTIDQ